MPNQTFLTNAKEAEKDEFYTQYQDIEKEINHYLDFNPKTFKDKTVLLPCDDPEWSNFTRYFAQNFNKLGLKKLISTSYANDSKPKNAMVQLSLFEQQSPQYDKKKTNSHGKIFTLTKQSKRVDINDLKWKYLEGDGDYNSQEVKKLRDEADIIITNPPFSKFREFVSWILEANKKFLIIGNINCITYKEIFPLLKKGTCWLGTGMGRWISGFIVPDKYELYGTEATINEKGQRIIATNNCLWLTNLDHGKRHKPLENLMTAKENIKYNQKLVKKLNNKFGVEDYTKYDNYDAIDVPFYECIPSDFDGIMGVPITFLDKFNPEQFELLYCSAYSDPSCYGCGSLYVNGIKAYARVLIRRK